METWPWNGRGRVPQTEAWALKDGAWPLLIINLGVSALGRIPQTIISRIEDKAVSGRIPQTVIGHIENKTASGRIPQTIIGRIESNPASGRIPQTVHGRLMMIIMMGCGPPTVRSTGAVY